MTLSVKMHIDRNFIVIYLVKSRLSLHYNDLKSKYGAKNVETAIENSLFEIERKIIRNHEWIKMVNEVDTLYQQGSISRVLCKLFLAERSKLKLFAPTGVRYPALYLGELNPCYPLVCNI